MKCETCGRFMALTNLMTEDDELDDELALQCGYDRAYIDEHWFDDDLRRFVYIQDQWECSYCYTTQWHTEGKKYYWNEDSGHYDAERPLTLDEQKQQRIEQARVQAEAAGQLELPL